MTQSAHPAVSAAPALAPCPAGWRGERLATVVAWVMVLGFLLILRSFWVPAHPGLDANGYLVGGKMLAAHGTAALQPRAPGAGAFDPHQFVGVMWVGADLGTPAERYYPKYPLGYPALVALGLRIGGPAAAYAVNPLCTAGALVGVYYLIRRLAGAWLGLLAMLLLASSPTVAAFATTPVSHASALCAVTWGMLALLLWHDRGGLMLAALAGLLLGYAATIRYTEALLLLPLLVMVAGGLWRRTGFRRWCEPAVALLAWAVPVAAQLAYNRIAFHAWTGYGPTNESAAFAWAYFDDNWDMLVRHTTAAGLILMLPVGILGLGWMAAWRPWTAAALAAWVVPCVGVYSCYYFAKEHEDLGYVRFIVTALPGVLVGACWLLGHVGTLARFAPRPRRAAALWTLAVGLLVALGGAVQAKRSSLALETDHRARLVLDTHARQVLATAPAGSVVFCEDRAFDDHLQFVGDYVLYTGETFSRGQIEALRHVNSEEPQVLDPARRSALYSRLKDSSQGELAAQQFQIIRAALAQGRHVFALAPLGSHGPLPRLGASAALPPSLAYGARTGDHRLQATVAGAWRLSIEGQDRRTARQRLWGQAGLPAPEVSGWLVVEIR